MKQTYNLNDYEPLARSRLPSSLFGFISGGAGDNVSLQANRAAFDEVELVPQVLQDTSGRDASVRVFDRDWAAPFGIAPMGAVGVSAFRADLVLAQGAADARIPFVLSGASLVRMERVLQVNPHTWFQMYASTVMADNHTLLNRAWACGVRQLVLTVDVPVSANREHDLRSGYSSPLRPSLRMALEAMSRPRWLAGAFLRTMVQDGMPHFENFAAERTPMVSRKAIRSHRRDTFDWTYLNQVRQSWKGHLVLKGVLAAADIDAARKAGVDAVVVSNHGGRQLDGAVPPIRVLPELVRTAGPMPVFADSGVRRGIDLIKLLGLGASMVFVGRPFLYAAAVGGAEGVARAIALLKAELLRDMALLGVNSCAGFGERLRWRR